jgi:hypothetical protein
VSNTTPSAEASKALSPTQKKPKGKANGKAPVDSKPEAKATAPSPINPPVQPLAADDPFAAGNFSVEGESVPTGIDDLQIEIGAPSDEEFVMVSSDPRHMLKANMLVVNREDGYGKSYFLLTPAVAAFVKSQASLKKFFKAMRLFLYVSNESQYGLWLVRDSLDNWSVSDLQVVNQAKKTFTRRYTDGKVRKGHSSTAIPTEGVQFPDKPFIGADGILAQAFGEAFVITTTDHSVLNKLLGKA